MDASAILTPSKQIHPSILVVEDDSSLLNALAFALETEGFHVDAYPTGAALLDGPVNADCMVIDMKLPGHDGLTLIAGLRMRGISPPAILITTNPDEPTRRRAQAAGVEIVEKPLITAELTQRIHALLDGVAA